MQIPDGWFVPTPAYTHHGSFVVHPSTRSDNQRPGSIAA